MIKALQAKLPVDRQSLETFFHTFGLTLTRDDHTHPIEPEEHQEKGGNFFGSSPPVTIPTAADLLAYPLTQWGEAPEVSFFYGRQTELAQLTQWIAVDRCKLIALLGMGGLAKLHW